MCKYPCENILFIVHFTHTVWRFMTCTQSRVNVTWTILTMLGVNKNVFDLRLNSFYIRGFDLASRTYYAFIVSSIKHRRNVCKNELHRFLLTYKLHCLLWSIVYIYTSCHRMNSCFFYFTTPTKCVCEIKRDSYILYYFGPAGFCCDTTHLHECPPSSYPFRTKR